MESGKFFLPLFRGNVGFETKEPPIPVEIL